MGSENKEAAGGELNNSSPSPSSSHAWKSRIVIPTLLAGPSLFLCIIVLLLLFSL